MHTQNGERLLQQIKWPYRTLRVGGAKYSKEATVYAYFMGVVAGAGKFIFYI